MATIAVVALFIFACIDSFGKFDLDIWHFDLEDDVGCYW